MANRTGHILLTGNSNLPLAQKIAAKLKTQVFTPVSRFADSEAHIQIPINIRRKSVTIIQSTCPPEVDSSIVELILMIDAARRASADEIIVVLPYFGYSRQDRKDKPRVPISSSAIAKLIETAGANHICTVDIHSDQAQGFTSFPWDNVYGSYSLVPAIKKLKLKNLIIASPDKGGVPTATAYAKRLNAQGLAIAFKERDLNLKNTSKAMDMIGDVTGCDVLLVDDMVDTAGTLCNAASLIKQRGAKRIVAAATHGLFSANAIENIEQSPIETLIVTDTIPQSNPIKKTKKIIVASVAPLLAEAIKRIQSGESISEKLILR
jgi:ribose-phosphate pyrophosphokinase